MTQPATCAHCSAPLAASDQFCTVCGTPVQASERSRSRRKALIGAPLIASPIKVFAAVVLDILVLVLVIVLGIVTTGAGGILLAIVVVLAQTGSLFWWGQSLGWRAMGLRLVADSTGSAPGFRRGALLIADVRRGPDPVDPFMTPPLLRSEPLRSASPTTEHGAAPIVPPRVRERETAARAPEESPQREAAGAPENARAQVLPRVESRVEEVELTVLRPAALRAGGTILVVDGDRRLPMTSRMLIGRNPVSADGETVVAIPDLGRELSKSHLLLEQEQDGSVFVTDLRSTNGTTVNGILVGADVRVPVSHGSTIIAGGHTVQVLSRIRAEQGAMV